MNLAKAEQLGGPCACGQEATTTNVARTAMCETCAVTLLDIVRGRLTARRDGVGQGWQTGPLRPDYGPNWADLMCDSCGAGWTGPFGDPCSWCEKRVEQMRAGQRRLLLRPDLPDRADRQRSGSVKAWGDRLRIGYEAGTISRHDLDAAWNRETT